MAASNYTTGSIPLRVKQARLSNRGMTQYAASVPLGWDKATVQKYERQFVDRVLGCMQLSELYGVSFGWLLAGERPEAGSGIQSEVLRALRTVSADVANLKRGVLG